MAPTITMRLEGVPPQVLIHRDSVDDDAWDQIVVLLADVHPPPGKPLSIPPEILIRERLALRGVLHRNGVSLSSDHTVTQLLRRSIEDDNALQRALRSDDSLPTASAAANVEVSTETDAPAVIRALREFQQRDLERLIALNHGANFSVPGAGKTTVAYALHAHEKRSGRVERLLVVAPLSAFEAWEDEAPIVLKPAPSIVRWRDGNVPDADVVLVNYQRLPNSVDRLASWMAEHAVHLVIDEAHRAKRGASGGWGRALLALAPLASRRDILTGTPAPNHPRDLASLLDILWPGGAMSRALPATALQADPALGAMNAVNDVIRPLYVRTTKEELGLPRVKIRRRLVRPGELQQAIYDAMLSRYAGMFDLDRRDGAMFAQMGEVYMYLLQAASSPRLLSTNADPGQVYRYPPLAIPAGSRLARLVDSYRDHEVPAKIAQACTLVHRNARLGRKTLVWSNFPDNLLDLEQQLAALEPALVYGGIPSVNDAEEGVRTRERELDRFRNDPDCLVLLANPAAMAEGVSLHHSCHDAVYIDRTFNAGQYLQSLDRIHRLGLEEDTITTVTLFIASGTIDERVDRRVDAKTRRLSKMLDDPTLVQMALPDDDDYGTVLDDPVDLEEILRHLREARSQPDCDVRPACDTA